MGWERWDRRRYSQETVNGVELRSVQHKQAYEEQVISDNKSQDFDQKL